MACKRPRTLAKDPTVVGGVGPVQSEAWNRRIQPGYNWHNDGNEAMSDDDMDISDQILNGLPGYLGTPRGTIEEYMLIPGHRRKKRDYER
jgi:hypothetical protein